MPSGTVDFRSGAKLLGSAALDGTGRAVLVTTGLPLGPQDLRAGYRGDGDYLPSTSAPVAVRVGPAATTTVASGPGVASRFPAPVTFVARVSVAAPGGGVPVGRVQFRAGALILGSAPVDGAGVAVLTVQRLPAGRYSIMAYYLGSDAYGPSNSAAVAHTVVG